MLSDSKGPSVGLPALAITPAVPLASGAPAPVYLLRDLFSNDVAAGALNGTPAVPGPGTRSVTDGSAVAAAGSGRLVINGNPATVFMFSHGSFERIAGRVLRQDIVVVPTASQGRIRAGWSSNISNDQLDAGVAFSGSTTFHIMGTSSILVSNFPFTPPYRLLAILRPTGVYLLGRAYSAGDDGIDGSYQLLLPGLNEAVVQMYDKLTVTTGAAQAITTDSWEVLDLGGRYGQTYGLATEWVNAPTSGEAALGDADGWTEVIWTPQAGSTLDLKFRYTDDDNCLILRCDQAGGTIKLFDRTAGVETEYAAGKTQTFTAGTAYRVWAKHVGTAVLSWVNLTAKHVATISAQQAVAGAKVVYTGAAANLATHPWAVTV